MNNSSKYKSKRSDKSPKSKPSYTEAPTKGSSSSGADSNHESHTAKSTPASTPAQSPVLPKQYSSSSQGGATVVMTVTPSMTSSQPALLSPSAIKPSPTLWFTTEIQQMMYGFGDCRKPFAESAGLVEEIVHQQMMHLLYQAEEVARLRNARFLGIEDFLFLLRKDKTKLRRLLRYMTLKDVKTAQLKATGFDEEEPSEQTPEMKAPPKKRRKICYDFLSTIDQTGELVALFDDETTDEVKHERALRAEMLSRHLDAQQYLEYCEARQAGFTPRYKIQKFKDWLMTGICLDIKPNPMAMEVLSYLAYEIVAQVVDLALLVKKDHSVQPDDPLSVAMPGVCINHDDPPLTPGSDTGSSTANMTSNSGMKSPTSPTGSPPATPTTPVSQGSSSALNQSTSSQNSLSSSATKSKSKKKKKSGSSWSRDVFTSQAITPADIQETMRRYGQCVGPFADFSKCPLLNPVHKLLCC